MAITKHDLDILNRCHDDALKEMASASAAIAEKICEKKWPTQEEIDKYRKARIGVEATRRDLEYCIGMELSELLDN